MSMTVCVYRLRLAKLNEQMKEDSDMGKTDDTFQEVFREFSNMASNNPELLRRNMIHIDQSEQSDVCNLQLLFNYINKDIE
jgi:phytoene/squalene synthetase